MTFGELQVGQKFKREGDGYANAYTKVTPFKRSISTNDYNSVTFRLTGSPKNSTSLFTHITDDEKVTLCEYK